VALLKDYITGFRLSPHQTDPTFKVVIDPGQCRGDDDTNDIISSSELVVSLEVSGKGGLDQGSEAPSTWYYVFAIYDPPNKYAGLFSTSKTSPVLPSGFTIKRRIGVVRNDSNSDLIPFIQTGKDRRRDYLWDVSGIDLVVLSMGNSIEWATIDCSSLAPPVAEILKVSAGFRTRPGNGSDWMEPPPSPPSDKAWLAPYGKNAEVNFCAGSCNPEMSCSVPFDIHCDSSQRLKYKVDSDSNQLTIAVRGFEDEV